jgi:hypothetical protein
MANTYEAIATVEVGSGGAADIEFTSIPATYTDLEIKLSGRCNATNAGYQLRLNIYFNGSTSGYSECWLQSEGNNTKNSGTNYFSVGGSNGLGGAIVPSDWTASTFGNTAIYIPNYAGSNNKSWSVDSSNENNGTFGSLMLAGLLWSNSAAITSVKLNIYPSANFVEYSTATLYGIKNS